MHKCLGFLVGVLLSGSGLTQTSWLLEYQKAAKDKATFRDAVAGISVELPTAWQQIPNQEHWTIGRFGLSLGGYAPVMARIYVLMDDVGKCAALMSDDACDFFAPTTTPVYTFRSFSDANDKDTKVTNKEIVKLGDQFCHLIEAESPSRRVKAWVFSRGGAEFIVEVSEANKALRELPAGSVESVGTPDVRLRSVGAGLADSFRFIEQTPKAEPSLDERWLGRLAPFPDQELWRAFPQVKRHALRRTSESRFFESTRARLVGWRASQTGNLQVFSQASVRFEKDAIRSLGAYRGWLDKVLGSVGDDRVRRSILLLCASQAQADLMRPASLYLGAYTPIVIHETETEFLSLYHYPLWQSFLHDKDAMLPGLMNNRLLQCVDRVVTNMVIDKDQVLFLPVVAAVAAMKGQVRLTLASAVTSGWLADLASGADDTQQYFAAGFLLSDGLAITGLDTFVPRLLRAHAAESAKSKDKKVDGLRVLAGVMGDEKQWARFERSYGQFLKRHLDK